MQKPCKPIEDATKFWIFTSLSMSMAVECALKLLKPQAGYWSDKHQLTVNRITWHPLQVQIFYFRVGWPQILP
jgi:hypothetical protein